MSSVNLTLNKPATQSSFVLPYSAAKAVDGSLSPLSRWQCNSLPGWISVDLGRPHLINRWVVYHPSAAGFPSPGYNISDYKLQRSANNTDWFIVDSVVGNTLSVTDLVVAPFQARYVRIQVDKGLQINQKLASIVEFGLYEYYEPSRPSRGITFFFP